MASRIAWMPWLPFIRDELPLVDWWNAAIANSTICAARIYLLFFFLTDLVVSSFSSILYFILQVLAHFSKYARCIRWLYDLPLSIPYRVPLGPHSLELHSTKTLMTPCLPDIERYSTPI